MRAYFKAINGSFDANVNDLKPSKPVG